MAERVPAGSLYHPSDAHNRRARALVHPEKWPIKPATEPYDLIAIGGGTAGLVSAAGAAMLGAKVALVERHFMGGDCLVTGCVPSKTLLQSAHVAHVARGASAFGVRADKVEVDFAAVMERVRRVRADIAADDGADAFKERGIDVLFGTARFTGKDTLDVDGQRVRFKRAVICTGSRPRALDVPGAGDVDYLTSDSLWSLTERPAQLIVIGGGPIGCEMAQAFARLGSSVTLLQRGGRLLPADIPGASAAVLASLRADGVQVELDADVVGLAGRGDGAEVRFTIGEETRTEAADKVLVAIGRTPNVDGLGLADAGVKSTPRGVVADRFMRTSNRRIYAAGDVCSALKFTHTAYAQAEVATLNALLPVWMDWRKRVVPWVTYTDPEVAHVGMPWRELAENTGTLRCLEVHSDDNDRMRTEGESGSFAKVWTRRGSDKIAAATVVGRHAGETIAELGLAMHGGVGLAKLGELIHAYPTRSDFVRKLADQHNFERVTPLAKRVLAAWLKLLR